MSEEDEKAQDERTIHVEVPWKLDPVEMLRKLEMELREVKARAVEREALLRQRHSLLLKTLHENEAHRGMVLAALLVMEKQREMKWSDGDVLNMVLRVMEQASIKAHTLFKEQGGK